MRRAVGCPMLVVVIWNRVRQLINSGDQMSAEVATEVIIADAERSNPRWGDQVRGALERSGGIIAWVTTIRDVLHHKAVLHARWAEDPENDATGRAHVEACLINAGLLLTMWVRP
jgi:hypothetical protein